jgi:hypothetical protein
MIKMAKLPMRIYNKVLVNLYLLKNSCISDKISLLPSRELVNLKIVGISLREWDNSVVFIILF